VRFRVEQQLATDPDATAQAFADPALYAALEGLPKVSAPEVLEREVDGARVRMRIRYRFAGHLSSAARAAIDPSRLTWVEESEHDLSTRHVRFVLHPDHYRERFRCRGEYQIVPSPGGCRRSADIDLSVSFPLVGRAVERAIASGLREHLADEARIVEEHLSGRR
jgi:hypothetical protein